MGLELGDRVRVLGCGCEDISHAGERGVVSSLGLVKRIGATFADQVSLSNRDVCADPVYLELL